MPRLGLSGVSAIALVASMALGCGGGSGTPATQAPGGGSTTNPGGAGATAGTGGGATAGAGGQATPGTGPATGGSTVLVTLASGPDAGTYTGTGDPGCSIGFFGTDVWGVLWMLDHLGAKNELSYLDLVAGDGSADEMRPGVSVRMKIGFGPLGAPKEDGYRDYNIEQRVDGKDSTGSAKVEVQDGGATAVIHITGETPDPDGSPFDITVNCPGIDGR